MSLIKKSVLFRFVREMFASIIMFQMFVVNVIINRYLQNNLAPKWIAS